MSSLHTRFLKLAAQLEKSAAPVPADPGGYTGKSDHVTAHADNRGQTVSEGSHGKELDSELNSIHGSAGVGQVSDHPAVSQESLAPQIGMSVTEVGNDPALEQDFKGDKDDPGTTSIMTADDGEKYSSADLPFHALRTKFAAAANDVLSALANGHDLHGPRAPQQQPQQQPAAQKTAAQQTPVQAEFGLPPHIPAHVQQDGRHVPLAGYELAEAWGVNKAAAYEDAQTVVEETLYSALADAEAVGTYLNKRAADKATAMAGEGDDADDDDEAAEGGAGDAELAALLDGAGGPGGDPSMGGDPGAAGDGNMGGTDAGGGEPSEEELLAALAAAQDELGAAPADMAGGMLPVEGGQMIDGGKVAAEIRAFKRSGKYEIGPARDKRARALRDRMKANLQELLKSAEANRSKPAGK